MTPRAFARNALASTVLSSSLAMFWMMARTARLSPSGCSVISRIASASAAASLMVILMVMVLSPVAGAEAPGWR